MRVGVFISADIKVGGGFQQQLSVVKLLKSNPLKDIEYVFFVLSDDNKKFFDKIGINTIKIKFDSGILNITRRTIARAVRKLLGFRVLYLGYIDNVIKSYDIDLAYFMSAVPYAMGLKNCPFIFTVWDQCHRDWPEFPEVSQKMEFEFRDFVYQMSCTKAVATLVDSETARKSLSFHYGVDLERIFTAPFFPDSDEEFSQENVNISEFLAKYSLKKPFIFYPAQLWPHKNHAYILEALRILKDKNIIIEALFTGTNYGNGKFLKQLTEELGLTEQIHFAGFVDRKDIILFYKNALALVMPTYLGHTNIPPLEAFKYGCPVCYSDLPDLREQVGDAAFLMDLANPESLANILTEILSDENKNIVQEKIKKGYDVLKNFSPEKYLAVLEEIFKKYAQTLKTHKR